MSEHRANRQDSPATVAAECPDPTEQSSTRQFASQHLLPRRPASGFDSGGWQLLFDRGLFSPAASQSHSIRRTAHLLKAVGSGGADRGLLFAIGAHYYGCTFPVIRFGSPSQLRQMLPALQNGQLIGCLAITEEGGGSGQSALATQVQVQSENCLLTGAKLFVTNAPIAHVALVIASEWPQRGSLGLSAFLVPLDAPGVSVVSVNSMGLAGAPAGVLRFNDVCLPPSARLGAPGAGLAVMLSALRAERTALLSGFLGAAEFDLARCYRFLQSRFSVGQKSGTQVPQVLQHRLAEIRCELAAAETLLDRGLHEVDHGADALLWPAMVKKTVSETVASVADQIHQIYAGQGWLNLHESATAVLDTRAILAASGTSEVMLNMIWSQFSRTLTTLEPSTP
jgi:acyl-CoA dehydrogenase